uniref:Uncharacterized protein n=1 Tax=Opuntia streptacantha TaxID=393608 RepID=A0A7C9E2Z8_OPUST
MGRLNPSTRLTPYEDKSLWPWWSVNWASVAGATPPSPSHSSRPPQSPVAHLRCPPVNVHPVRAQMRPDQWVAGARNERWVRVWRANPPRSKTGKPELGWMAGQMVKGQLFTTVRMSSDWAWARARMARKLRRREKENEMKAMVFIF